MTTHVLYPFGIDALQVSSMSLSNVRCRLWPKSFFAAFVQHSYQIYWIRALVFIQRALDAIGLLLALSALILSVTALDVAVLRFSLSDDWETTLFRLSHCSDLIDSLVRLIATLTLTRGKARPRTVLLVMVLYDMLKRFALAAF